MIEIVDSVYIVIRRESDSGYSSAENIVAVYKSKEKAEQVAKLLTDLDTTCREYERELDALGYDHDYSYCDVTRYIIQEEPVNDFTDLFEDEDVKKMAVKALDVFSKIYCRDKTEKNDLKFRCKECPFENRLTGQCSVKIFWMNNCPEYKDFGSMGDL
jgi:hypothetical protein